MPVEIFGKRFFTVTDVTGLVDVTRQTIWRWRKAGKIPDGRKYRGREVLFTRGEVEEIYSYANRLEPTDSEPGLEEQHKLFTQEGA